MEKRLVTNAGFDFAPIKVLGFQRHYFFANLKNNLLAALYLLTSGSRAKKIISQFKPDVVFGTGGYVSGPVLRKAAQMGYNTLAMENNAYPGVTTKLLCRYVKKILLVVEDCKKHLPADNEYVVTGNPIRDDIFTINREESRQFYNVKDRICIVSFGGSLGAQKLNDAIGELMLWHTKENKNFLHIHATGSFHDPEEYKAMLKEKGLDISEHENIVLRKYIDDMPRCLAAADLVIARSGAITLSELEGAGKASILIPSPNVAENHQYHNAKVLEEHGAAIVIEEKNLSGELLSKTVEELTADREKLKALGERAKALAILDANDRICAEIYKMAGIKKPNP